VQNPLGTFFYSALYAHTHSDSYGSTPHVPSAVATGYIPTTCSKKGKANAIVFARKHTEFFFHKIYLFIRYLFAHRGLCLLESWKGTAREQEKQAFHLKSRVITVAVIPLENCTVKIIGIGKTKNTTGKLNVCNPLQTPLKEICLHI